MAEEEEEEEEEEEDEAEEEGGMVSKKTKTHSDVGNEIKSVCISIKKISNDNDMLK